MFCRWGILTRPQVGDFKVAIRDMAKAGKGTLLKAQGQLAT